MNETKELLNSVYQGTQMGMLAIEKLIPKAKDPKFLNHLRIQYQEYENIHREAKKMLLEKGQQKKDLDMFTQMIGKTSITLQTLKDNSTSHMAQMMLEGSNMGIIEGIKNLKQLQQADLQAKNLAQQLVTTEENNYTNLKEFLS